jgi:hypothetical protein
MKNILITSISILISFTSFAQERVEHECVPAKAGSHVSRVQIVYSPSRPFGKEFLEIYNLDGQLSQKWEVQYTDDMTYIAYLNVSDGVYFERDWPVENDQGPGILQLGSWTDPSDDQKTFYLNCSSPKVRK